MRSTRAMRPVLLALLVATGLTSGCGFHLRGRDELPEHIDAIHVQGGSSLLTDEIKEFLKESGATIVPTAKEADVILTLGSESYDRRLLSVDPTTGKEREFELSYTVYFDVHRVDGTPIVTQQGVTLLRDYVFDPNEVIGKSREEAILQDEMKRDAAAQILARIDAALE